VPVIRSDGALFGTLCGIDPETHARDEQEVAALTVLARLVAFQLDAAELARLQGVRLAARTAEHEVKNALVPASVYAGRLATAADLPAQLRDAAEATRTSIRRAADLVDRLAAVDDPVEIRWGAVTTIDLSRGAASP
jgi:GAF domain-containing protein